MRATTGLLMTAMALAAPLSPAAALDLSSCNGEGLERFIGKPVKEMQRVRKDNVRYVCSTCAATQDFSAERLTVTYDTKTGLVTGMSCN